MSVSHVKRSDYKIKAYVKWDDVGFVSATLDDRTSSILLEKKPAELQGKRLSLRVLATPINESADGVRARETDTLIFSTDSLGEHVVHDINIAAKKMRAGTPNGVSLSLPAGAPSDHQLHVRVHAGTTAVGEVKLIAVIAKGAKNTKQQKKQEPAAPAQKKAPALPTQNTVLLDRTLTIFENILQATLAVSSPSTQARIPPQGEKKLEKKKNKKKKKATETKTSSPAAGLQTSQAEPHRVPFDSLDPSPFNNMARAAIHY